MQGMHCCPRCGTPYSPHQAVCSACGFVLRGAAEEAPRKQAKHTLLGVGRDASIVDSGLAPPGNTTMFGHAAPEQVPSRSQPPAGEAPPNPGPAAHGMTAKTMLGMAPVQVRPAEGPSQQTKTLILSPEPAPPPRNEPPASDSARLPSQFKTMLGVARPGIAPLNPGVPKAPTPRPGPNAVVQSPYAPALVTPAANEAFVAPPPAALRRRGRPLLWVGAAVLLLAVVLLGIAGGSLLFRRTSPITATLQADESGAEFLDLHCEGCVDGTNVRLGTEAAKFSKGHASLKLNAPLAVGSNALALALTRPGAGSASDVSVTVPVQYRIRGDFAALSENHPQLRVLVEANPQASVVIDGHAIALDKSGKGSYSLDVSAELTGAAATVTALTRTLPYTIAASGGAAPESGQVHLKIGIVPLLVYAPGERIVVEGPNFMLAGQTQANGSVTVAGRAITVDASGQFAQLMSVSAVGETTIEVRASAAGSAPRLFPLRVKRVASFSAEAEAFTANASLGFSGIANDPDLKKGWAVVLTGTIAEARELHHTSVSLLEIKKGCAAEPCFVRLVYGASMPFSKGAAVRAFGHVQGAVAGPRPNTKIPEVRVEFFLPAGRD